MAAPAAPPPPAEQAEWKKLSGEWKQSLGTLIESIDKVNTKRAELEKQKEMLRRALTQGRYDVIQRERALELYKEWNQGIQMIPLYPEDYAPRLTLQQDMFYDNPAPSMPMYPLSDSGLAVNPGNLSGYVYELDEGLIASQKPREWIHVAPPDLFTQNHQPLVIGDKSITYIAPPPGNGLPVFTQGIVRSPQVNEFPITAIADWRVRPINPTENLLAAEAVLSSVPASPLPLQIEYRYRPLYAPSLPIMNQSLKNQPRVLPFVSKSIAKAQKRAISKQYQRTFYPQDMPR